VLCARTEISTRFCRLCLTGNIPESEYKFRSDPKTKFRHHLRHNSCCQHHNYLPELPAVSGDEAFKQACRCHLSVSVRVGQLLSLTQQHAYCRQHSSRPTAVISTAAGLLVTKDKTAIKTEPTFGSDRVSGQPLTAASTIKPPASATARWNTFYSVFQVLVLNVCVFELNSGMCASALL
jgi:hypothetical protein